MRIPYLAILCAAFMLIASCSSGDNDSGPPQSAGEHVWKQQTEAMEKAKEMEQIIQNAAEKERRAVDEQFE